MRSAGSVIMIVSGFLLVVVALAQGYVGIPLLRPRRPGVHLLARQLADAAPAESRRSDSRLVAARCPRRRGRRVAPQQLRVSFGCASVPE